ncbi:hypothetical protein [Geitlerinema sp. PCC 9228]|uniref:hypothetical protein n=1 Tax=Geitlerinema sp. PCC 9228 TaxID=111611 RepID=UPI0011149A98|nr:hypothetical protein [Geitlerinema sp. PCC 9228]
MSLSKLLFAATSCQIDGETKQGIVLAIAYDGYELEAAYFSDDDSEFHFCFQPKVVLNLHTYDDTYYGFASPPWKYPDLKELFDFITTQSKAAYWGTWVPESAIIQGEATQAIHTLKKFVSRVLQAIHEKSKQDIEALKQLTQRAEEFKERAIQIAQNLQREGIDVRGIFTQLGRWVVEQTIVATLELLPADWLIYLIQVIRGIDQQKAQQEVFDLQTEHPDEAPRQIASRLIQNKAVSLVIDETAGEVSEYILEGDKEVQVDWYASNYALQELIYQIGVCYGFRELDLYEQLAIFATIYAKQKLNLSFLENTPFDSLGGQVTINATLNFISFYAIGYTARTYYQLKTAFRGSVFESEQKYKKFSYNLDIYINQQVSEQDEISNVVRETVELSQEFAEIEQEEEEAVASPVPEPRKEEKIAPPIQKPDQIEQFRATGVLIASWQPEEENNRSGVLVTPDGYEFPTVIVSPNWSPSQEDCHTLAAWNIWIENYSKGKLSFGLKGFLHYPAGDISSPDNLMDRFSIRGLIEYWNEEENLVKVTVDAQKNETHKTRTSRQQIQPLHVDLYGHLPNLQKGAFWEIEATRTKKYLTILRGKEVFSPDSPENPRHK